VFGVWGLVGDYWVRVCPCVSVVRGRTIMCERVGQHTHTHTHTRTHTHTHLSLSSSLQARAGASSCHKFRKVETLSYTLLFYATWGVLLRIYNSKPQRGVLLRTFENLCLVPFLGRRRGRPHLNVCVCVCVYVCVCVCVRCVCKVCVCTKRKRARAREICTCGAHRYLDSFKAFF
jgi:hypothetical protein